MRSTALHAILLLTGLIVSAGAQTPGTNGNMGQPMGPPPTVDVSGIQQQMQLKQAAGALKITYGKNTPSGPRNRSPRFPTSPSASTTSTPRPTKPTPAFR